jgi:hypothetical protein
MIEWLTGLPLGTVLGFGAKWAVDLRTERGKRQHDRQMRLLDTSVDTAVTFLSAAERTSQAVDVADRSLVDAKASANQDSYAEARRRWEEATQRRTEASREAEALLPAIYLLVPSAGDLAHALPRRVQEGRCTSGHRSGRAPASAPRYREDSP